jgi:hypothetical protein
MSILFFIVVAKTSLFSLKFKYSYSFSKDDKTSVLAIKKELLSRKVLFSVRGNFVRVCW